MAGITFVERNTSQNSSGFRFGELVFGKRSLLPFAASGLREQFLQQPQDIALGCTGPSCLTPPVTRSHCCKDGGRRFHPAAYGLIHHFPGTFRIACQADRHVSDLHSLACATLVLRDHHQPVTVLERVGDVARAHGEDAL